MSVKSEVTRLSNAKAAIASAIAAKGVTVPSTTKLDGMAPLIARIPIAAAPGEDPPSSTALSSGASATALTNARNAISSCNFNNKYAMFAGGYNATLSYRNDLDAYNANLTKTTKTTSTSGGRRYGAMASTVSHCIYTSGSGTDSTHTYCFDENLTQSSIQSNTTDDILYGMNKGGCSLGSGAFFAGGQATDWSAMLSTAGMLNENLTRVVFESLSAARQEGAAASVNKEYAIYAGGTNTAASAVVDCYDVNGTHTKLANLRTAKNRLAAAEKYNAAFFAGGYGSSFSNQVDIYNQNLTLSSGTGLSEGKYLMAAGSFSFGCVFAGGFKSTTAPSAYCDFYNNNHTKSSVSGLTAVHGWCGGATVKRKFIVAGGTNRVSGGTETALVKAFTYSETFS